MPQEQVITIGRDPSNTIVLDESNVSSFHARLTRSADKIVLEDLGSTNGTAVGQVENKIQHAIVEPNDTIFFGSSSYCVSDFITSPSSLLGGSREGKPTARDESKSLEHWLTRPRLALAGGGALILVVGIGLILRSASNDERAEVTQDRSVTIELDSRVVESSVESSSPPLEARKAEHTAPLGTKDNSSGKTIVVDTLSSVEKLERAIFVVVSSDPDRKTSYRIGTAFAVDAKHVVTSASVIQAMQELKGNGYSEVFLHAPATGGTLRIVSTRLHPEYEAASADALRAQREHDAIYDELESRAPNPKAFEAVKEQLLAARLKAMQAIERKISYDVALIELQETLAHWLPGLTPDAALRPNLKLEVTGFGFDSSDPFFDASETSPLMTMTSRVRHVSRSVDDAPTRLLASGTQQQFEFALSGSPALNAQGEVVAIYSRPTPSPLDADQSPNDLSFDAPLFDRVRECLAIRP